MTWQDSLRGVITDFSGLKADHPIHSLHSEQADSLFPMRIPAVFYDLIDLENEQDPLLKQVLPDAEETVTKENYTRDPLDEQSYQPTPGILHKYHGRVLLLLTGNCAIHCRYCFRRHFPYSESNPLHTHWQESLDYLRSDNSITEVIFSGGDPLSISDDILVRLIEDLEQITHIQRLRIHTRMPVVLPDRITDKLIKTLASSRLDVCVVLHVNHANELGDQATAAIQRCRSAGLVLLNQSVLLKDVNNEVDVLHQLSERLFALGVLPYYLHLLDPVEGAAHFNVDKEEAIEIHEALSRQLPGYLVPRLVQEVSGLPYKRSLHQDNATPR